MRAPPRPCENLLLDALPEDVRERLFPQLEGVVMPAGQLLQESGAALSDVWFPTSSIVSRLYLMDSGASAGVALIGREGVVGLSLLLGPERLPSEARVQGAGQGFRIAARHLQEEFERAGPLMHVLLHYLQSLIGQIMQTASCNRHGNLEQCLCRWLLLSLDRSTGAELELTQEWIAHMLGVRREGVTEAAGRLQQEGAIRYHRGHITVLDRSALERRVHGCYMSDRQQLADAPLPPRRPA